MWISEKLWGRSGGSFAEAGVATIGGAAAAVETCGEERGIPVYAPGGMTWRPRAGDTVLVLKGGTGGEERYVIAASSGGGDSLEPGELALEVESGSIRLRLDGTIELQGRVEITGDLYVNGHLYVPPTASISVI